MEARFGHDFSHVRIHADVEAARDAAHWNARAITRGPHIFLGPTSLPSERDSGTLLAHELTHVIQADRAAASPSLPASSVETLEGEARRSATAFRRGEAMPLISGLARDLAVPLRDDVDDLGIPTFGNIPQDEPLSGYRLKLEQIDGKWYEIVPGHENRRRASGWYNFVVQDGEIWAEKAKSGLGHTEAARGGRVTYAGQIKFTSHSGKITRWSNASGHYRPTKVFAEQAGLPMDKFKAVAEKGQMVQLPVFPEKTTAAKVHPPTGPEPAPPETTTATKTTTSTTARTVPTVDPPDVKAKPAPAAKARPSLGSAATWGKVSPFEAAMFYIDLHAAHFAALANVKQRAAVARDLLSRVEGLELGAREIGKALESLRTAERELPEYPLQTDEDAEPMVGADELAYVRDYGEAAARIANDAMDARNELSRAIDGWDGAYKQAEETSDFTRKAAMEAVIELELRFSNDGGNFRAYLVNLSKLAGRIESWARTKQYHTSDILGEGWVPESYTPPAP